MREYDYLDGNAVTYLWDAYVNYHKDGQTGDDISLSPFRDVVLSEYTVDECITIPVSNTYKKHLLFMSIFPNIPVLKSIASFSEDELNGANLDSLLNVPEFLQSVAQKRARALVFPQDLEDLGQDIQNKEHGKIAAATFLKEETSGAIAYVALKERISIKDAIAKIIKDLNLKPNSSHYDFYLLCMHLYVATRDRLINVPTRFRKGPKQMLNHQIDFYHLSYVPFIDRFVTGDEYLRMVAQEVVTYLGMRTVVEDQETYWAIWLRDLLTGK